MRDALSLTAARTVPDLRRIPCYAYRRRRVSRLPKRNGLLDGTAAYVLKKRCPQSSANRTEPRKQPQYYSARPDFVNMSNLLSLVLNEKRYSENARCLFRLGKRARYRGFLGKG